MKKLIFRGLAALALAFSSFAAQGQPQTTPLPQDPALRQGKLDNGLSYYIRHNETPKGQADFYIAQKVGSILEDDHQRGLAHFLEHMCFNGTENFPDKGIINWLETVGVKFGQNLNAYTSIDETVYNISSVPVARESVQDSCLLILHDWSCALTLDPEEINAERGVIHEEWRSRNQGEARLMEALAPTIYAGNKYGYRFPIGTMEIVDNFPPQHLVDYYHKWYRPDQQAIIVVGDINPDYIENKIKEIFSPIKMPENAAERTYLEVEDTPGTIYAIGKDKEVKSPLALMMIKTDDVMLPFELRNSKEFFLMDYMNRIIASMLNSRLAEFAQTPDCKYAGAETDISSFFLSKNKGAFNMQVVAKGNDIIPAFEQAYRELLRAATTGFTIGEYERARAEFLSRIEHLYESRNNRETEAYSQEYVHLFLDNAPAPGIETEKAIYDEYANLVNVDFLNMYMRKIVTDDNRAIMVMVPDAPEYPYPTEDQFVDLIDEIDNEDLEPYKDSMREDPLIPNLPAPGSITSTQHLDTWDATEYTLSNGVKVIVKPTKFKDNQIIFNALAKGNGLAAQDQSDAASLKYFAYGLANNGFNEYTNTDLKKYMQGKQVGADFGADAFTRQLEGQSTVKDLPTLMEFIYCYFTGLTLPEQEFNAFQTAVAGQLANQEATPEFAFSRDLMESLYTAPAKQMITSADVKAANRETILGMAKNMLANAADYTFTFVGSIDLETFIPLMEQYIATLPADAAKATTKIETVASYQPDAKAGDKHFDTAMENPQTYVFIGTFADMPYTAKNRLLASMSAQIMSKRLLNKIREEMGATYSIGAQGMMSRYGDNNTIFQIIFPMKPEMKDEALKAIDTIMNEMTTNVTADELKPVAEFMLKEAAADAEKNEEWAGVINAVTINGVTTFINTAEIVPTITVDDIKNFMKQVLDQKQTRTITLDPAAK